VAVLPAVRGGADAGPGTRVPALRAGASPICNLSLPDRDSQIVRHPTRHRIIGARGPTGTAWCELRSADAAPSFDAGVCGWRPCRYEVIDRRLAEQQGDGGGAFIAGSAYTIADIALYPWCAYHQWAGVSLEGLPHLSRWIEALGQREGVRRGLGHNPKPIAQLLADADAIRATVGATTLDKVGVSRPFPSWNRSILTEIYLCHACSCQEILRTETGGQGPSDSQSLQAVGPSALAATPPITGTGTSKPEPEPEPRQADGSQQQRQLVFNVVLTGGPCGGKSSSQQLLSEALSSQGFAVYFVPEVSCRRPSAPYRPSGGDRLGAGGDDRIFMIRTD
jgi:hypothetical protein